MMKKFIMILGFSWAVICTPVQAQTPSTSFETDFSEGAPTGNWYDWVDQMEITFGGGEMQVAINRTLGNSWDRLVLWVRPFDIAPSPYFSMKISSDIAIPLTVTFKDTADATLDYQVQLTGNDQWDEVFINLSDDLPGLDYSILAEIQFDPDPGQALQATLHMDEISIGDAAIPQLSPPTIDPVPNLLLGTGAGPQSISLTGISNGGDEGQEITVTAVSDNPELIPDLNVDYTSPATEATLNFTPADSIQGMAVITVTVTDDGLLENEAEVSFKVRIMSYGGEGFMDDFEAPALDSLWELPNPRYSLFQSDGVLRVAAGKRAGWESFSRNLPGFFDISANPVMNLDVKGSRPFYLHVYLVDAEDNNAMRQVRILNTDKFVTASFDFSGADGLNLDRITGLIFAFNGQALTFDGDSWFDNLLLGTGAVKTAYLGAVPDHSIYKGTGSHELTITDITDASGLQVTGTGSVVENLMVSDISDGIATLSYDAAAEATGSDTITLTAVGVPGYSDYTETFIITSEENMSPVLDSVANQRAAVGEEVTVRLTGINDGNPGSEQQLQISAISNNSTVIPDDIAVDYQVGPYASLVFTPESAGIGGITVVVRDDGGGEHDSTSISFGVEVFESINQPPTIDPVGSQSVFNDAGQVSLELTGISDGDNGDQGLTLTAVSSSDSIIPNPVLVAYEGGASATILFTPDTSNTGSSSITVKVVDDGAAEGNNGNDSVSITFRVDTRTRPLTGWVVPIGDGDLFDYLSAEQLGVAFFLETVDSGSFDALKIEMASKWEFAGMWMDLPEELDLTDYPYISYDVYPVGSTLTKTVDGVTDPITDTYHWNYFYDVEGSRNILNSGAHMYMAEPDKWTTLSFDYSDPGDMQTDEGEEIDAGRITDVLFNLHWRQGAWPFTDMSGTVYYRNIRIGDKAIIPERQPVATIDEVPGQASYAGSGEHVVTLTGISDGTGSAEGVTLSAFSGRTSVVPDPVVTAVQPDGTASLTFTAGERTGSSPLTVTVSAAGSDEKSITFDVDIVSAEVKDLATVTVDRESSFQVMEGMGTFENERRWVDLYAGDLGASAVRIGLIGNQIEPVNDNNDPYVLDMKALDYSAIDFEYFRMLKDAGVETFILTSWSPPAWMKKNLSLDWFTANAERDSDLALNRLEYHYYDEFAESMVAVVRMFEQEAGIHIDAIGLQNEPAFDEPYSSAILDPEHFTQLIAVAGKRFEEEGITTRLYMPEQVVGQNINSNAAYLDVLQHNTEANPYCDIYAVHGYGEDGITPGTPSYSEWTDMFEQAQLGDYPKKVWMTETHIGYQGWNSAISTAGAIHGGLWAGNISLWTNWSFGDMQLTKNIPNSTFYTSKNYFKYIRPGAVRKGTESGHSDVLATAFEHDANGTFTIVLINKGNNPISVDLEGNNLPNEFSAFRTTEYENFVEVDPVSGEMFILPASSVTTLYANEIGDLTMNDLSNLLLRQDDPAQTVQVTGISDGAGGTAGLTLSAEASDQDLITGMEITGVQADGTAQLSFTPGTGMSGTALVTVNLTDGIQTRVVKFYVEVESTVGIAEPVSRHLNVYPNPSSGWLTIELPPERCDELMILDITGRIVMSRSVGAENLVRLDLENLDGGMYHLVVISGGLRYRASFVLE